MSIVIRPRDDSDDDFVRSQLIEHWGDVLVVSKGEIHDASEMRGCVAVEGRRRVGLLTYQSLGDQSEFVTLSVVMPRRGIATMLLTAGISEARRANCRRVWLITTNDNRPAISLYQKLGFRLVAIHKDALIESRKLKPSIPLTGIDGIPITDEYEFEMLL